jgi:hypothetical protein
MTTSAPRPPLSRSAGLPVVAPKRAKPGYQRAIEVGVRSVHLVSMGLVLGGIGMGGTHDTLLGPIIATVVSGLVLLATSVFWGCLTMTQGAGWALLLKLALLGLGNVFPGARLFWYAAATIVSSVGSHMPSAWRHYSLPIRVPRHSGDTSSA